MVIGSAFKPCPFKKNYLRKELGFDYYTNRKAWMTSTLSFEWLMRFKKYVARTKWRKALLLLDKCSAHGNVEFLSPLQNARFECLPPIATSQVQMLDAGIISWVKANYKRRFQPGVPTRLRKECILEESAFADGSFFLSFEILIGWIRLRYLSIDSSISPFRLLVISNPKNLRFNPLPTCPSLMRLSKEFVYDVTKWLVPVMRKPSASFAIRSFIQPSSPFFI